MASLVIGKNIQNFISNDTMKYLETSKIPKNRIETQTINVEEIKNHLQK
jgi:hypothetical protein